MRHASGAKRLTSDRIYVLVFFMHVVTPIDPLAQMAGSDPSPDRTENCDLFSDEAMAAQAARHVRMLQELAELAMNMARRVAAEPVAGAEPADEKAGGGNPGLVLTRIARCVRQTVALEAKLAADCRGWVAKSAAERAAALAKQAERAAAAEARRRERKKIKVERAAKTVVECSTPQDQHDFCHGMLTEWLWDSDDDADFADRPVGEIIAAICRDLDMPLDLWKFEGELWMKEEMRTKPPSSPVATYIPEIYEVDPPDAGVEDPPASGPPDFVADDPPAVAPSPRVVAMGSDPP
jgi:hypothetical protein